MTDPDRHAALLAALDAMSRIRVHLPRDERRDFQRRVGGDSAFADTMIAEVEDYRTEARNRAGHSDEIGLGALLVVLERWRG